MRKCGTILVALVAIFSGVVANAGTGMVPGDGLAVAGLVATNCARLAEISAENNGVERFFDVSASLIEPFDDKKTKFIVKDDSGAVKLYFTNVASKAALLSAPPYAQGRFRGWISREGPTAYGFCDQCEFFARGEPPAVEETTVSRIRSGEHDYGLVSIEGVVNDVFRDENDMRFRYMVLLADGEIAYCSFKAPQDASFDDLVGARVRVSGRCVPFVSTNRRQIGRTIILDTTDSMQILKPAPGDPFNVPRIGSVRRMPPDALPLLGRRRMSGRVIAAWRGNLMMLRTPRGDVANVELSDGVLPACGETVEVVGFPETDLYRVNMTRAKWRKCAAAETENVEPGTVDVVPADIMFGAPNGGIDPDFHGRIVRLRGRVSTAPDGSGGRFLLECDGCIVPIETGAASDCIADIVEGCVVEATGACFMETDNWRPNAVFPKMKGFSVVLLSPDGIHVVSRPSWWTSGRLLALAGLLALAVVIILVWNVSLRRLAARRGRELAAGNIARAEADIRTLERTRLAVELHDSVAQNLGGAVMELETAARLGKGSTPEMLAHLDVADKTLRSTLTELRNCLWDLRNQSLDEKDFATALKRALLPHAGEAVLSIRFPVPRSRLTDNTAHAILRIARELVINAVRHGRAKSIKVAGAIEGDALRFSVSDDGCGFDPANRPGVAEGHFGIQGIRERIRMLSGKLALESAPGKGTKATISIDVPREDA